MVWLRWMRRCPQFADEALSVGLRAAYAIPMREREHSVFVPQLFEGGK